MGSLLLKIPGFYIGRLVFFVFLSFLGGAGPIYDQYLGPFLDQNQDRIDQGISMTFELGASFFKKAASAIKDFAIQQFREFITQSLKKKTSENN